MFLKKSIFSSFADWAYNLEVNNLVPEKVKCGDIIYLKTDYLNVFFESYYPKIQNPFILITQDSAFSVGYPKHLEYLNESKILIWYGKNIIAKYELN